MLSDQGDFNRAFLKKEWKKEKVTSENQFAAQRACVFPDGKDRREKRDKEEWLKERKERVFFIKVFSWSTRGRGRRREEGGKRGKAGWRESGVGRRIRNPPSISQANLFVSAFLHRLPLNRRSYFHVRSYSLFFPVGGSSNLPQTTTQLPSRDCSLPASAHLQNG